MTPNTPILEALSIITVKDIVDFILLFCLYSSVFVIIVLIIVFLYIKFDTSYKVKIWKRSQF